MKNDSKLNVFLYSKNSGLISEIQNLLSSFSVELELAETWSDALKKNYSVWILDFDSHETYKRFLETDLTQEKKAVLVGVLDNFEEKHSIFDIVLENYEKSYLLRNLELALELANYRQNCKSNFEVENSVDSKFVIHRKSIYSLATSLSQGPGFGTAVTTVDMLDQTKVDSGDSYLINKSLFDLLIKNNEYCRTLLEGLNEIVELLENELQLKQFSCSELFLELPKRIQALSSFFLEKKIQFHYSLPKTDAILSANKEKLLLVIEELLINSIKYSQIGSLVSLDISLEKSLLIRVKNQVNEQMNLNIPEEFRKLAREPFIRFAPPGEEAIKIHKYGLGLGLTAIDYIVTQHGGEFVLEEEKQLENGEKKIFIVAYIKLPIVKKVDHE